MKPRSLRGFALLGLAVAAVVVACSNEEEEKREAAEKAEAAAKDAFLSDYCEIVSDCCNKVLTLPKADPTCKQRISTLDPKMLDDAQARTDCLAQLRRVTALSDFCTEFGNLELPACPDAHRKDLTGAKKPGDACAADAECAPSFEGVVACKGVCQVTKRGKDGDGPCVATMDGDVETRLEGEASGAEAFVCFLRDELVCDPTDKKCIKPIALRGACTDSAACERSAFCDDSKECATRKASGSSCKKDECQGECVDGFCKAPVSEGGSCGSNVVCAKGLACAAGKCSKPPEDARLAASCVEKK
ncbi:MAG: hypothetical protein KF764_02875 [Labilithrix sp.]|nr:hypothetical protein [Labilithrix sp.]